MDSESTGSSISELMSRTNSQNKMVYVCGFVADRLHNSCLQSVVYDLVPSYYVATNGYSWNDGACKDLLANAHAFIFFVNEFTLSNQNCLLTLQYAWHLTIPIIMLRPPRTKLVIRKAEHDKDRSTNGRGVSSKVTLLDNSFLNVIDYPLLQDILYQGYKMSTSYNSRDHPTSMKKIYERLRKLLKTTHGYSDSSIIKENGSNQIKFYLSPSNESSKSLSISSIMPAIACGAQVNEREDIRLSRSMNNLNDLSGRKTPHPLRESSPTETAIMHNGEVVSPRQIVRSSGRNSRTSGNNNIHPNRGRFQSTTSATSSIERRLSMSSLDDMANYNETHYLVFSLKNYNKKPTLINFPYDLQEEEYMDNSVWGSDTSLEEEAEIAPKITTGLTDDLNFEESPITSPIEPE